MLKPHIVILGAGFAGTYVAKRLSPFVKSGLLDITIVNKTNYFLFTPLLHEVATGSLDPTSVAEPLREIFHDTGIELCQGVVNSIDMTARLVNISNKSSTNTISRHSLPYDYLVIATGAETNFYGISGAEKYAMPLKDLSDAANIRSKIIDCFEEAIMSDDKAERARLLSFVVVGGGPTGVEVAAELKEFTHEIVSRYYSKTKVCEHSEVSVSLIHAGIEPLQQFAKPLREIAFNRLSAMGVSMYMNSVVTNVTSQGLSLSNNSSIASTTIIWAAGVKPVSLDFVGTAPTLLVGRLLVDEKFHVNGDERTFALGDMAAYIGKVGTTSNVAGVTSGVAGVVPNVEAKPIPMLAQAAIQEADIVAGNIISSIKQKPLKSFSFHPQGYLVSLGKWFATGDVFSKIIQGKMAWFIWRTTYLFKFASWKKRIRIAFEWTVELFFVRDITKLI
jgi:NADH dehydrogenase